MKDHSVKIYLFVLLVIFSGLTGCATYPGHQVPDNVAPIIPGKFLSDSELLNVSIQVFHPGTLPSNQEARRGLTPEIREAEARFIPIHLKHTLQSTGYWGAVRVVPDNDIGAELLVKGRIEMSDGESIVIDVEVVDARNVVWFSKKYAETARPEEHLGTTPEKEDAFQDLFNTIANDLAYYRNSLTPAVISEIRQTAILRYSEYIAPDALGGYLTVGPDNCIMIQRLPAGNEPMFDRVKAVKARDDMLVDAINDYYDIYYHDLWEPYADWRKFRQEEVSALRQIERQALAQQIIGITAIVGAIALGVTSDYETSIRTQPLQELLITGGAYSMYSSFQTQQEGQINKDAIEELGGAFSSEAEPLVLNVEGKTVLLTGSAEQQYAKWRTMLRQIYAQETGLIQAENPLETPAADKPHIPQ